MSSSVPYETDIAILGSGASGSHGLLEILTRLCDKQTSLLAPMRITVIERDRQFHSGLPYGHRSGRSSLLISDLEHFLPDRERSDFIDWLEDRREEMLRWAATGDAPASPLAEAVEIDWILRHEHDIRHSRWEGLYLPRRLYGQHLAELVADAVAKARNVASVDFVHGDIDEITHPAEGGVRLRERIGDGGTGFELHAHSLLLAIGSPPVKELTVLGGKRGAVFERDSLDAGIIADLHEPSLEHVIERTWARLESLPEDQRDILLVGGNADALEFILASHRLRRATVARLHILCSRGRPHYWHHDRPGETASTPHLDRLFAAAEAGVPLRAQELSRTVAEELKAAIRKGNVNSTIAALIGAVGSSLAYMDDYERYSMATEHGLIINDVLRRAGGDSLDLLIEGIDDGTIDFVTGRFRDARIAADRVHVTLDLPADSTRAADSSANSPDRDYAVVVNGTGFERVTDTRSALLRQMLGTGLVRASASRTGLVLDSSFRAASGVFVLGPLIAGHTQGRAAYWHIESVIRILSLAGQVADELVADLLDRQTAETRMRIPAQ
ncbi:FAD/NAD(P)-binding protein [Brevibacterium sp. JSBI002]|uniref:FAD/NAD(P)-binding protein n=1 Tax=Brevibacterium sp. JSBI002 TaxID=2886045 RepID=UPI00222F0A8B|nr:FAD/NAD(P)-binding protein [Brevibacterium sp. JSBI002]UZD62004.1 FAD/NAD(P)-binding protein [Brevibacterium sp. JSBI002]